MVEEVKNKITVKVYTCGSRMEYIKHCMGTHQLFLNA